VTSDKYRKWSAVPDKPDKPTGHMSRNKRATQIGFDEFKKQSKTKGHKVRWMCEQ